MQNNMLRRTGSSLLMLAITVCGGCAAGTGNTSTPAPTTTNVYVGTQTGRQNGIRWAGGLWTTTLDPSNQYFSYQNVSDIPVESTSTYLPVLGSTTSSNGFLVMNGTQGVTTPGPAGYAVEVPGEAALVRPGYGSQPLVPSVQGNACTSLSAATTYQFISLGSPAQADLTPRVAYGSVQAQNSGVNWTFSNLQMSTLDGEVLQPAAIAAGTCAQSLAGFAISIPTSVKNAFGTFSGEMTAAVSPGGYFLLDQDQGNSVANSVSYGPTGQYGLVGIAQPKSQIDTASVVSGKYLGFEYNPVEDITFTVADTWPVAFGQTAGSGTVMTGGNFANDDVTKPPAQNMRIDLGPQDATNNGLYKSVVVTLPDAYGNCARQPFGGTDANGNAICTFPAVAIIGSVKSKYAIYIIGNDLSLATRGLTPLATFDVILYQQ